ncbi:phenylacetate-CoA oxygenase/reductase subunit PaaK [Kribbella sandramycini]|uniref:Phenylacetate-CoA oxygenase/reductase subunit PaaK n=1 Tax=Kribbella sandramycini TaxID=60450 RepID=A0A7Y4KU49_9ACTN|nr:1,2-phenylacetyl-CoA epoxidase subunit PaaE [Kribbella sandramycini]MBB6568661.1 ring-1,2-phenylacetyl-CoA epoxidase subunit PaaE [Kribbella sandramycini]NOL38753.1 phenylacetate-CoA oxygenase/reductase subunit PaaK [Kribbella sandramycini]
MTTVAPRRRATFHALKVAAIEPITDDSVAITFAVPPELAGEYEFTAGQHLTVRRTGEDVRRSYSICSPAGSGVLRIGVKRIPGGTFSAYAAHELQVGDELEVMTPLGRFGTTLDPANAKHYAFVAAGSGITPVLSLVSTILSVEPSSRVTLLYGNRTAGSVMFADELADLKDRYAERLHLVHVLSRESTEVELFSGRIDADRLKRMFVTILPIAGVDEWFLCGPYAMVVGAQDLLLAEGVAREHVHAELFHVGDEAPKPAAEDTAADADAAQVTVILDGRRSTFALGANSKPVLDATLAVRSDAPFACKGGVCGTCRAKVLDGSVRMDTNWALEPGEIRAGYVLTCQSHPTTPTVTLDFDA